MGLGKATEEVKYLLITSYQRVHDFRMKSLNNVILYHMAQVVFARFLLLSSWKQVTKCSLALGRRARNSNHPLGGSRVINMHYLEFF